MYYNEIIESSGFMKKLCIIFLFILLPLHVDAKEREFVTLKDCVDGDTATVMLNEEEIKLRFLAVDTPETKHPTKGEEPYGKEASDFTCTSLKTASSIEIEYDENADILDKYNRHLVWVFVDDVLLQKELVQRGYAKVAYLYDDYKYTKILQEEEKIAKSKKIGIWAEQENIPREKIIIFLIIIICFIIFLIFDQKYRKKTVRTAKRKIKKKLKNSIQEFIK